MIKNFKLLLDIYHISYKMLISGILNDFENYY
jgi:hypothetical protein